MLTYDELYSAALTLPDETRADFALRLLDSLPATPPPVQLSPDLKSLLLDRIERYESGQMGSEEASVVIDRIMAKLKQQHVS